MSSTENYTGACPICKRGLMQRHESTGYGYIFDACPWCGYVVDNQMEGDIRSYRDVKANYLGNWTTILSAHKFNCRKDLIEKLELEEFPEKDEFGAYPSIFKVEDKEALDMIIKVSNEFTRETTVDDMLKILDSLEEEEKEMNIIRTPLTKAEITKRLEEDTTYITGVVPVDLSDIIDNDLEGLLDIVSEKLIGSICLMDINYKCIGVENDGLTLLMEVSGDASDVLDEYDEE